MRPIAAAGVGVESPATLNPLPPPAMAKDHPDAPKQFGIRLTDDTMELICAIQDYRKRNNQPTTLASVVEDAIRIYYTHLVDECADF